MRSITIFIFAALALACGAPAPKEIDTNSPTANTGSTGDRPQNTIAHSTENRQVAPVESGGKTKWTRGGDPIDTKELDAAIAAATKDQTAKSTDPAAKKALSTAYFKRAVALTDARQYASALGDYRRALKYDPENAEAKQWVDMIISIYDGKNQEYPKEGEEPPPLPFTKGK